MREIGTLVCWATRTENGPENRKQPSSFTISADNGQEQPSIREIYDKYKPVVKKFILEDTQYKNACRNSDKGNAMLEGLAAMKRAALMIEDLVFMKLFYDIREFHDQMEQEILSETYMELSSPKNQYPDLEEPDQAESISEETESAQEESISSDAEQTEAETDY